MKKIVLKWLQEDGSNLGPLTKELRHGRIYFAFSFIFVCFLWALPGVAQSDLTVSGTLTDENGQGLPGATVLLKEARSIGTVTDIDGSYSLRIPGEYTDPTLVFSYVGYLTEEVSVGNQTVVDLRLLPNLETLSELVVIGYGTQKKKDVTGSISSIDADELKTLPVASVGETMQGRAAGVRIVQSGQPGSSPVIRIRGASTINNNDPLVVIDGVPIKDGLNTLNPNDIESIQVLKDASAAAIYGSRGANGVVIVTTNRGKGKSNQFNVDFYTGVQQATSMVDMVNARQFAALNTEMLQNNNQATNPAYADPVSLGDGTDWLDAILRTAPISNVSVSYAGSGDKSNFYVSGSYFDQEGIVTNTGYKRYTMQLNSDHHLSERFMVGNNLSLNHDVKTGNNEIFGALRSLPVQTIYSEDGGYSVPKPNSLWYGTITNPVGLSNENKNITKGYNIIGSLYGEFEIIDGLLFRSTVGLQGNFWDTKRWEPANNWRVPVYPNSTLDQGFNKSLTWLWDNTLTYTRVFNNHNLTAVVGTSAQENQFEFLSGFGDNIASPYTQVMDASVSSNAGGNISDWSLFSYFGRINYSYKDKYLLTGTIRRDGSSRFGAENKFGTFPSMSAAWRISEEGFFSSGLINDLKLRVGYGETGNQEIGNYAFASLLDVGVYNFGDQFVNTIYPKVMPNSAVQWETVIQSNIGLDVSFLSNRINFTADAFLKNTQDMLVPFAVPISSGYSPDDKPFINAGEMENKGIELTLSTVNMDKNDFSWNTDFNFTYLKNKLISINDTVPQPGGQVGLNYFINQRRAGYSNDAFFGYITDGIFLSDDEVAVSAVQVPGEDVYNRTSAGDIRFKDLNNDGVINSEDRDILGSPYPDFIFAMNNRFAYKGFELTIFLQGVYGNEIFNYNRVDLEGMASIQNQTTAVLNRWQSAEQPGDGKTPRAIYGDPNANTRPSDRFIEDGSYLRVKNVTLGYSFPQEKLEKIKLSNLRIYASAQNLFTLTAYSGFDPEVGDNGIDNSVYPLTRTISVGVNLGF